MLIASIPLLASGIINLFPLSPIATLTALAVKFSTTKKHCKILTQNLEIMFPIDVMRFSEFRAMRNHLSETLVLNDIQFTSDYMFRWVALKRRVGAVDFLVLYVTWRPFVFSNQFDLYLFVKTTENSSIFRLLTKESMLLTLATLLIEKRS
jgi:hypothetical protein